VHFRRSHNAEASITTDQKVGSSTPLRRASRGNRAAVSDTAARTSAVVPRASSWTAASTGRSVDTQRRSSRRYAARSFDRSLPSSDQGDRFSTWINPFQRGNHGQQGQGRFEELEDRGEQVAEGKAPGEEGESRSFWRFLDGSIDQQVARVSDRWGAAAQPSSLPGRCGRFGQRCALRKRGASRVDR